MGSSLLSSMERTWARGERLSFSKGQVNIGLRLVLEKVSLSRGGEGRREVSCALSI